MLIKDKLAELGIEYKAKSSYNTLCPKCSADRFKSTQKCLQVKIDSPTTVAVKCFNGGCELNKMQYFDSLKSEEKIEQIEFNATVIPYGEAPIDADYWHPYVNDEHKVVMLVQRTYKEDGSKDIFPWFMNADGDWFRNKPTNYKKFLYREEKLSKDKPVVVVEGELKADELFQLFHGDYDVVSWQGGANNVKSGKWELLKDRHIILWPDNNAAGHKAMEEVASLIDTRKLFLVDTSKMKPDEDVGDLINTSPFEPLEIEEMLLQAKDISKPLLKGILNVNEIDDLFKDELQGAPFGYKEMDKYISYPYSGLMIIAGRVGHGKSALMVNMVANLLQNTDSIVIVGTYEVVKRIWLGRLLQVFDGKKYKDIDKDDIVWYDNRMKERNQGDRHVQQLLKYIQEGRLLITDSQNDATALTECMKALSKQEKKVFVFVDYLQIVPPGMFENKKRHLTLATMAQSFNNLANEYKQVVVAGSQLANGNSPYEDQVKESRAIKEAADQVFQIFNKNDERAKKRNSQGEITGDHYDWVPGEFVINVDKTRLGGRQFYFGFSFTNNSKLIEATKSDF